MGPFIQRTKGAGMLVFSMVVALVAGERSVQADVAWVYNVNDAGVAVDGFDVVGYFDGVAERGLRTHAVEVDGISYWFATAERRGRFLEDPERYRPACGGWDAVMCGMDPATAGFAPSRWEPTPTAFRIRDGRLVLLSERDEWNTVAAFDRAADPDALLERADAFWRDRLGRATAMGSPPAGMNRRARLELADWTPLLGTWRCEGWVQGPDGADRTIGTADWIFGFGYDGYVIEDHWRPHENPGSSGPAFRIYDPLNDEWGMVFMPSSGPSTAWWRMTGRWVDGEMRLEYQAQGGVVRGRVRFHAIRDRTFRWVSTRSTDAGETWVEGFQRAECARTGPAGAG